LVKTRTRVALRSGAHSIGSAAPDGSARGTTECEMFTAIATSPLPLKVRYSAVHPPVGTCRQWLKATAGAAMPPVVPGDGSENFRDLPRRRSDNQASLGVGVVQGRYARRSRKTQAMARRADRVPRPKCWRADGGTDPGVLPESDPRSAAESAPRSPRAHRPIPGHGREAGPHPRDAAPPDD
jgi:hypothetical protein